MNSSIHYTLSADPLTHLWRVALTIAAPAADGQTLYLPVWTPGSYLVREFARNIYRIYARSGETAVPLRKLDKHRWQADPVSGPLVIEYEVYGFDLSVRGSYLDGERGFFNPNVLFLAVEGQEQQALTLELQPPTGHEDWQVATGMPRRGAEPWAFGTYGAANYEAFIDYPVEMGRFERHSFAVAGIPHHLVVSGKQQADLARLAADLEKVCAAQIALFGEAPFAEYWFLLNVVGDGYGGLEHRNATALLCSRDDLQLPHENERKATYMGFLGLASHEYFHSWNVKAIKPAVFSPYDLHQENYTVLLWAFEGITSYYDDLMLLRCGLMSVEQYLEQVAQTLSGVRRGGGRLRQTLEEASFDAWIKYYRPDENAANALVSYYTQGALTALALDLTIRQRSEGAHSLDTVMRALYQRFGKSGLGVGEREWEAVAAEVTGLDLTDTFERLLRRYDDIRLHTLFPDFGIELQWRPAAGFEDKGGWKAEVKPRCDLGVRPEHDALGVKLASVQEEGPAQLAGLAAGDIVIAIDQLRVSRATLDSVLARYSIGRRVSVHAFRRDELFSTELELRASPATTAGLRLTEGEHPARAAWLGASGVADTGAHS